MPSDIPKLKPLLEEYHGVSAYADLAEFDWKGMRQFLFELGADHILLVLERTDDDVIGVWGGLTQPLFFAPTVTLVQEMLWWVKRGAQRFPRGAVMLQQEAEQRARRIGAKLIIGGTMPGFRAIAKLYTRRGYRAMEDLYLKEV